MPFRIHKTYMRTKPIKNVVPKEHDSDVESDDEKGNGKTMEIFSLDGLTGEVKKSQPSKPQQKSVSAPTQQTQERMRTITMTIKKTSAYSVDCL